MKRKLYCIPFGRTGAPEIGEREPAVGVEGKGTVAPVAEIPLLMAATAALCDETRESGVAKKTVRHAAFTLICVTEPVGLARPEAVA